LDCFETFLLTAIQFLFGKEETYSDHWHWSGTCLTLDRWLSRRRPNQKREWKNRNLLGNRLL
jgi:hypothetical protein